MNSHDVKALRIALKIPQHEFAKLVYSSQSMIAKYELGKMKLSPAVMAHIEALARTVEL